MITLIRRAWAAACTWVAVAGHAIAAVARRAAARLPRRAPLFYPVAVYHWTGGPMGPATGYMPRTVVLERDWAHSQVRTVTLAGLWSLEQVRGLGLLDESGLPKRVPGASLARDEAADLAAARAERAAAEAIVPSVRPAGSRPPDYDG